MYIRDAEEKTGREKFVPQKNILKDWYIPYSTTYTIHPHHQIKNMRVPIE